METLIEIIAELRAENKELKTSLKSEKFSSDYWYKKHQELEKQLESQTIA